MHCLIHSLQQPWNPAQVYLHFTNEKTRDSGTLSNVLSMAWPGAGAAGIEPRLVFDSTAAALNDCCGKGITASSLNFRQAEQAG